MELKSPDDSLRLRYLPDQPKVVVAVVDCDLLALGDNPLLRQMEADAGDRVQLAVLIECEDSAFISHHGRSGFTVHVASHRHSSAEFRPATRELQRLAAETVRCWPAAARHRAGRASARAASSRRARTGPPQPAESGLQWRVTDLYSSSIEGRFGRFLDVT